MTINPNSPRNVGWKSAAPSTMRRPCRVLWLTCALLPLAALAQSAETRPPTAPERAAFQAYLEANHQSQAKPGAEAPVFHITRSGAASPWHIEARIKAAPRRALRSLCRMDRLVYIHDGQWRPGPVQQFAWHAAASCNAPANPIALGQRMPDTDILALIEQQGALLTRARLLFAGNTACAAQRSFNYRLAAIDVGIFVNGSEEMATLTYQSDRGPTARVWARRSGLAYDPWNVSCP